MIRARLLMSARRLSSVLAPAPTPITTIRPFVASALRFAGRLGAPTSSRMTSNGPCSSKPSGSRTSSSAEARDGVAQLGVADRRRDERARRARELDRRRADAARPAVDEQPLARPQAGLREDRVVGGREDLRQAAGVGELDRRRDPHELALVHDRELGLAAAADDPHDAVALGEPRGARAERLDDARELEPRDVRRGARRRRVAAAQLHLVGPVEARAAHAHEHLAGPGDRVGMLFDERPRRRGSWRHAWTGGAV